MVGGRWSGVDRGGGVKEMTSFGGLKQSTCFLCTSLLDGQG